MKRFYTAVSVEQQSGGHAVLLDGKPLRTPAKKALVLPTRSFAEAVAGEWSAQSERILPLSMPLTQLVNTAIDRLPHHRHKIVNEICSYAPTDLVCYRAERPTELVERQARAWNPLLEWLERVHGVRLQTTKDIHVPEQEPGVRATIEAAVAQQDDLPLTGLHFATVAAGSVVIALALCKGELDAEAAHEAAQLDALYQLETWGDDEEARRQIKARRQDLAVAASFLRLCREG